MKVVRKFIVGSRAFFSSFNDFASKDCDEVCIIDRWRIPGTKSLAIKLNGKDVFFYERLTKEEFIEDALNSDLPMKMGKFLVPEFADYIGFTIKDLAILKGEIDKMDERHSYEKIIYNSYIENNDFVLTDEQLAAAYEEYKEKRR